MGELARKVIAKRAAEEIQPGMVVNLGIGIPSLVPEFIPSGISVMFQAENGILGMGPRPKSEPDPALINAAGYPVSIVRGGSYFDSAIAFGMIRRGYIDLSILGALQVSSYGDLANWLVPGKIVPGVGGAMELAHGARFLVAVMTHCDKDGNPKIVGNCSLPLTARKCVNRIITERAVFTISKDEGLILDDIMPGYELDDIRMHTDADFQFSIKVDENHNDD